MIVTMNVPALFFIIQFSPICTMSPGLYKSYFDIAPLSDFLEILGKEKVSLFNNWHVNRLAGGMQGGAPHITVLSQRRGARRGLAGELVRRMSQHQGFSFRHVDLDSVDTGSGDLACGTREAGNITFLSLHCTLYMAGTHDTRFNETLTAFNKNSFVSSYNHLCKKDVGLDSPRRQ